MDSVESVQAWREARQNIAARKPAPVLIGSNVNPDPAYQRPPVPPGPAPVIVAREAGFDGGGLGEDFDTARTREKIATANLAEIEEAALRGTYIVKADFERHLFNAGRMLRDTLTNCARRIGAEVSGLDAAESCEAVIDREHRAALASFSQALRHSLKIETGL